MYVADLTISLSNITQGNFHLPKRCDVILEICNKYCSHDYEACWKFLKYGYSWRFDLIGFKVEQLDTGAGLLWWA